MTFSVEVTNRGATPAQNVTVRDTFDSGLEPQSADPNFDPRSTAPIVVHLGDLAAGQTRQFSVTFRVTKPGRLCHRVEAIAGDGGRTAPQESCVMVTAPAEVPGIGPGATGPSTTMPGGATVTPAPVVPGALPIDIRVIPEVATATAGKLVVFTANVRNLTQQPLANVTIRQQSDAVLPVKMYTKGGGQQGGEYVWTFPSLPPGRIVPIQVQCECRQPAAKACCRFTAVLSDGRPARAETCIEITPAQSAWRRHRANSTGGPAQPAVD